MMLHQAEGIRRRIRRVGTVTSVIVCFALIAAGCGGSGSITSTAPAASDTAYRLLGNSVRATGKILSRTNTPAQLKGASDSFSRQLDPIDQALTHLAGTTSTLPVEERDALTKAARIHRRYMVLLVRSTALPAKQGRSVLNQARKAGGQTRDAYKLVHRYFPESPDVLGGVDLTDTLGLAAAMDQVIKKERDEAAAQQQAQTPTAPDSPSGTSTSGCVPGSGDPRLQPVVSCVKASVSGGMVNATVSYCDRTPGGKQSFRYVFLVQPVDGGAPIDGFEHSATQSYACRDISSGSMGPVTSGVAYYVEVAVFNDSLGRSGTGTSAAFVP